MCVLLRVDACVLCVRSLCVRVLRVVACLLCVRSLRVSVLVSLFCKHNEYKSLMYK